MEVRKRHSQKLTFLKNEKNMVLKDNDLFMSLVIKCTELTSELSLRAMYFAEIVILQLFHILYD